MDLEELGMLLESVDVSSITPADFQAAAEKAKQFKLDSEHKLQLYGLFKQSTIGNNCTAAPTDMIENAKWQAWKAFDGFPKQTAAAAYVFLVNNVLEPQQLGEQSSGRKEGVGFQNGMGVTVSTLLQQDQGEQWDENEFLFKYVVENDTEAVKGLLAEGVDINAKDSQGLTALHYAADRGHLDMVKLLVTNGANRHETDEEGQTAMDYAVACEQEDVVGYLEECRNLD